jgi:RimJ/RimL family protein N-acetyltransferase
LGELTAPSLQTERLIIRAFSLDDWDAYAAAWADPRMTAFIGGQPRSRAESWGKLLQGVGLWPLFGYGYWVFIDRETGIFLGNGGLARFERGIAALEGHAEAGWSFVPDAWGRGLATEGMSAIFAWADANIDATEIRAIIDHDNVASNRVATKCGFSQLIPVIPELQESALWQRLRP